MKKLFTLTLGLMLTVALFAADRRPMVTVTAAKRYEVVIDGRHFMMKGNTMSIPSLFNGRHQVKVFEVRPGFFTRKVLVASSTFQLRNNDVRIAIDRFGNMQIKESRIGRDRDNDRRNDGRDRDNDRDRDWDNNGRY